MSERQEQCDTMKRCSKCGEEKSIDDFSLGGKRKLADGTEVRYRSSWCKACIAKRNREYFKEHPEKLFRNREREQNLELQRARYHKNPEKERERNRKWRESNRDKHRQLVKEWRIENRFKIAIKKSEYDAKERGFMPCAATPEEIESAFTGRCQACGILEADCNRKLAMDHDHKTGEFRGWLCWGCNINDVLAESGEIPK